MVNVNGSDGSDGSDGSSSSCNSRNSGHSSNNRQRSNLIDAADSRRGKGRAEKE